VLRPLLEVRRAEVQDVDDLLQLWSEARQELTWHTRALLSVDPVTLRARLVGVIDREDVVVLVARVEGRPAGYLLARSDVLASLFDTGTLHVEHLFVTVAERRRGVARALVAAVAAIAERRGAEHVVCNVAPVARDTHRFLARLGFSPLVFHRIVATNLLRRRLAGHSRRPALEDLLSRRRTLRARERCPERFPEIPEPTAAPEVAVPEPVRFTSPVVSKDSPSGTPRVVP
jgi:ribosomal protein S18 acetylase RimI-like enzyme